MSSEERRRRLLVRFFTANVLQAAISFGAILIALYFLQGYVKANYEDWIAPVANQPAAVMSVFFLNEIVFGFIPPEIFMAIYSGEKPITFWKFITIMTALSYLGGMTAYAFGWLFKKAPFMQQWMKGKSLQRLNKYYNRFGGILILIS